MTVLITRRKGLRQDAETVGDFGVGAQATTLWDWS